VCEPIQSLRPRAFSRPKELRPLGRQASGAREAKAIYLALALFTPCYPRP
jgi:hypothetical protein